MDIRFDAEQTFNKYYPSIEGISTGKIEWEWDFVYPSSTSVANNTIEMPSDIIISSSLNFHQTEQVV